MINVDKVFIKSQVVRVLQDIMCDETLIISDDMDLVGDLKIDTDDLSFIFVPDLEDALSIKTRASDWKKVNTVGDTVELLFSYCND